MSNSNETYINEFDEYNLQIKYNKWINYQNKLQRGCNHITKEIFSDNINYYLNNVNWWENDPARVKSNLRWKGHCDN